MTNVNIVLISLIGTAFIVLMAYLSLKKLFSWRLSKARPTFVKQKKNILVQFVSYFCLVLVVSGAMVFSNQLLGWMKTGVWLDMSVLSTLTRNFLDTAFVKWLNFPKSWIGLNKIVEGVLNILPVSLTLVVIGFLIFVATNGLDNGKDK